MCRVELNKRRISGFFTMTAHVKKNLEGLYTTWYFSIEIIGKIETFLIWGFPLYYTFI